MRTTTDIKLELVLLKKFFTTKYKASAHEHNNSFMSPSNFQIKEMENKKKFF